MGMAFTPVLARSTEADCPWPLCEQWLTSNPANESKG